MILYLAVFGLLRRPALSIAAFGGLAALGILFRVAYVGSYRHAGVFLCFLICPYWIAYDAPGGDIGRRLGRRPLAVGRGALAVLILAGICRDRILQVDSRSEMSSSKTFATFIEASPAFRDAILVGEPDYYVESLPYYVHKAIYFPREHRFGTTVSRSSHPRRTFRSATSYRWRRASRHDTAGPCSCSWGTRPPSATRRAMFATTTTDSSPGAPGKTRTPAAC